MTSISKDSYSEANGAFANCVNLSGELIIPDTVEFIGVSAFSGCASLSGSLIIPNSVKTIKSSAFSGCSGFNGNLILSDNLEEIDYGIFFECNGFIGDLIIPNKVTVIYQNAFSGCTGFDGILTLSESLTDINVGAFKNCSSFTGSLKIPNSVKSIGTNAFYNCTGFDGRLTLSKNLEVIGGSAFQNCRGLIGDLIISDSVNTIGSWAFNGCSGLDGRLVLSKSITRVEDFTFSGCSGLKGDLILSDSITYIGRDAFSNCVSLGGKLYLPKSLEAIGAGAFHKCSGFTGDLIIQGTVETLGYSTFYGCSGFDGKLKLPDSMKEIGQNAFSGCSGLKGELVLPKSVETIGISAFNSCSNLSGNIIIPNSVVSIGASAFDWCNNVEKIIIKISQLDVDTNYKTPILSNLPNTAQTVIDIPYDFNVTGTWMENTNKRIGKPVIKNIIDDAEGDLIDGKGDSVSLHIPSVYKEHNISVLRDGKKYSLPKKNINGKYIFTEVGNYQLTITTDLGNTSVITFEVEPPIIREIEAALNDADTIRNPNKISDTRLLINNLPESIKKDQLQERLNNISPDMELERKSATANLDIYIKSENMLSLSLDTNSVDFKEYSGAAPMELAEAVDITVSSSLPYDLNAYMPVEISNADGSSKIGFDVFNIKESSETDYEQFIDTTNKVVLKSDCAKGNGNIHKIDLKLDTNQAHKADIYKTVIRFEAQQK